MSGQLNLFFTWLFSIDKGRVKTYYSIPLKIGAVTGAKFLQLPSDLVTTFYPALGKGMEMDSLVSALSGTRLSYGFKDLTHAGTIAVLTLAVAMTMASYGNLDGNTSRIVNAIAILFFVAFFMVRHLLLHIRMGELDESIVDTKTLKSHVENVLKTFHVFPRVPDWVNYLEVTFCAIMFGLFVTVSTHLM